MSYSLTDFKLDVSIGARRALRDLFAPVVGLFRWILRCANEAADRNIREAREICRRR
jgi:hypothetical protein